MELSETFHHYQMDRDTLLAYQTCLMDFKDGKITYNQEGIKYLFKNGYVRYFVKILDSSFNKLSQLNGEETELFLVEQELFLKHNLNILFLLIFFQRQEYLKELRDVFAETSFEATLLKGI